jgi:hypothetical protein
MLFLFMLVQIVIYREVGRRSKYNKDKLLPGLNFLGLGSVNDLVNAAKMVVEI